MTTRIYNVKESILHTFFAKKFFWWFSNYMQLFGPKLLSFWKKVSLHWSRRKMKNPCWHKSSNYNSNILKYAYKCGFEQFDNAYVINFDDGVVPIKIQFWKPKVLVMLQQFRPANYQRRLKRKTRFFLDYNFTKQG